MEASPAVSAKRPRLLSGLPAVWLLAVLVAAAAAFLFFFRDLNYEPILRDIPLPWWLLVTAFFFAEWYVVHLQMRASAHSFSLSEIPLVAGLFIVSPAMLLSAQLVGAGTALIFKRRQKPLKAFFNLATLSLNIVIVTLVFRLILSNGAPLGARGWIATLVGLSVASLVSVTLIATAIGLTEGRPELSAVLKVLAMGVVVSLANGCLALVGVQIVAVNRAAAWLVAVPAVTLFFAYRGYSSQRQKLASLEFLYEATRASQSNPESEAAIVALLTQGRKMFGADISEITFFPTIAGEKAQYLRLGPDEEVTPLHEIDLDPTEGVWARIVAEGEAILLPRPIPNPQLRSHFNALGIDDLMVAPLRTENGVVGLITIANHLGDVTTFDAEDLRLFETLVNHASVWLENVRLIDRLEESLVHLTEMNRLKDDFVATVSHELRTPLTSIQGYVKTLLRPEVDFAEEDRRSFLEVIDRQSLRLRNLIEDLLVVSRLESHDEAPQLDSIVLSDVVSLIIEEVAEDGGKRFAVELAQDLPVVVSDQAKLRQILTNLMSNAIKYSDGGGQISITGALESEGIMMSVTDQGVGIPAEFHERVFDRFYQVDQTSTRKAGGTGLGLYISRRFAEAIGGRVWLESSSDEGSTFCLWVPLMTPMTSSQSTPRMGLTIQVDP